MPGVKIMKCAVRYGKRLTAALPTEQLRGEDEVTI